MIMTTFLFTMHFMMWTIVSLIIAWFRRTMSLDQCLYSWIWIHHPWCLTHISWIKATSHEIYILNHEITSESHEKLLFLMDAFGLFMMLNLYHMQKLNFSWDYLITNDVPWKHHENSLYLMNSNHFTMMFYKHSMTFWSFSWIPGDISWDFTISNGFKLLLHDMQTELHEF